MRLRSAKSNLGEWAGARWPVHARIMLGSCSDHARIMLESAPQCKRRFIRFQQISLRFSSAIVRGRRSIWWSRRVTHVAPRIANDTSYVSRINHERGSIWWCCSVIFHGRRSIWWCCSVTFRGRCNIWWSSCVTFRGRRWSSTGVVLCTE